MSDTTAAAAATADAQTRAAVAGEPGPGHAGAVHAPVMLCDDLNILVPLLAVAVSILDAEVREMHLLVEVGQPVLACPLAYLFLAPIRMSVVVGAVAIALV